MSSLRFKLAEYDILGNFIRFEYLSDQVFICETPKEEVEQILKFGTTLVKQCSFDLSRLTNKLDYPKQANMFYDLFLEDFDGTLIDVPVKILQAIDYTSNPDMESWMLNRRFFLYDTITGIEEAGGFNTLE